MHDICEKRTRNQIPPPPPIKKENILRFLFQSLIIIVGKNARQDESALAFNIVRLR